LVIVTLFANFEVKRTRNGSKNLKTYFISVLELNFASINGSGLLIFQKKVKIVVDLSTTFFHGGPLLTEMCSVFLRFSPLCLFSIHAESNICHYLIPHLIFSKHWPCEKSFLRILRSFVVFRGYGESIFFRRLWRIRQI
jgi:hypothetical protein